MQEQDNYKKVTCLSSCGCGGHINFTSSKKCSADGEYLNTIVTSMVAKVLNIKKNPKYKSNDNPDSAVSPRILTSTVYKYVRSSTWSDTMAIGNG